MPEEQSWWSTAAKDTWKYISSGASFFWRHRTAIMKKVLTTTAGRTLAVGSLMFLAKKVGIPLTEGDAWDILTWVVFGWGVAKGNEDLSDLHEEDAQSRETFEYLEGLNSYARGTKKSENPYPKGSLEFMRWNLGWNKR